MPTGKITLPPSDRRGEAFRRESLDCEVLRKFKFTDDAKEEHMG